MLRNDILQQDYRVLYLAWLKATAMEDSDDASCEPPVPPGLGKLSGSLRNFVIAATPETQHANQRAMWQGMCQPVRLGPDP